MAGGLYDGLRGDFIAAGLEAEVLEVKPVLAYANAVAALKRRGLEGQTAIAHLSEVSELSRTG